VPRPELTSAFPENGIFKVSLTQWAGPEEVTENPTSRTFHISKLLVIAENFDLPNALYQTVAGDRRRNENG
jgi:hypothetical protein